MAREVGGYCDVHNGVFDREDGRVFASRTWLHLTYGCSQDPLDQVDRYQFGLLYGLCIPAY